MKVKQQNKSKMPQNGVQTKGISKKQKQEEKPIAEEVVAHVKKNDKKLKNGKAAKKAEPPKKVIEEVVEEDEDDSEEEEESDAEMETAGLVVEEASEDEDEDDEDGDDDEDEDDEEDDDDEEEEEEVVKKAAAVKEDDEEEDDDDEDDDDDKEEDDDEAPEEQPIAQKPKDEDVAPKKAKKDKKEKPQVDGSKVVKINTAHVPQDFPDDQVIVAFRLPKTFKQAEIVNVFGQYGTIHTIHPQYTSGMPFVTIAFTTAEAAKAALAANNTAKVQKRTLAVVPRELYIPADLTKTEDRLFMQNKDRSVFVRNISTTTSDAQIREVFKKCGAIKGVCSRVRHQTKTTVVIFEEVAGAEAAVKLNRSLCNGQSMRIAPAVYDWESCKTGYTITVKCRQECENVPDEKFREIFEKFGEIERISVFWSEIVLSNITFKDPASCEKAVKLDGTIVDGLLLEVSRFQHTSERNTMIFVSGINPETLDEEIRHHFPSGEIVEIKREGSQAIIKFTNCEGFCRAFLQHKSILNGRKIFIKPSNDDKFVTRQAPPHGQKYPSKFPPKFFPKRKFGPRPGGPPAKKPFKKVKAEN